MTHNEKHEYFAFISYKREDEKWAKRLQRKLESYRLPTALRKKYPDLPGKIRPIFRDQSDLAGGNLNNEIEKSLDGSKYLIVICSPRSAKSPWVSKEVQYFINHGREDAIIPFIIGGIPNSPVPQDECFPEGLRNLNGTKEILGININEMGRSAAMIKVVARMLGLRFDILWQRYRRKRVRRIVSLSSVAILLMVCALCCYRYFKTSRSYYLSYELCNGMPTGIDEIGNNDLKSYVHHYTFEYSRNKLRRVIHCNTWGAPVDESNTWSQFKEAILEIVYEGDRFNSITYKNAISKPLYKIVYNDDYTRADIKDVFTGDAASLLKSVSSSSEMMLQSGELNLNTIFTNSKSQIARFVYVYDGYGYISRVMFKKYNGSYENGYDANGISGIEYIRDKEHRIVKKRYLDGNGNYMEDISGCAGTEYQYDENGLICYERSFDLGNENCMNDLGYSISRITNDITQKTVTETHYDLNDKPCITKLRYCRQVVTIKGDTAVTRFYSSDMRPNYTFDIEKSFGLYHCAKYIFDSQGCMRKVLYYDTNLEPTYDYCGIHSQEIEYDESKRPVKYTTYNTDGQKSKNSYGYCVMQLSYDELGNVVKVRYANEYGLPVNVNSFSTKVMKYNGNRMVRSETYDSNGMPAYTSANLGVPVVEFGYDDFGNITDLWEKDATGSFDSFNEEFAVHLKAKYINSNCVELAAYNSHGDPVNQPDGFWRCKSDYNERGACTRMEYYDTENRRAIVPKYGFAAMNYDYDRYGRITESRTYNEKNEPVVSAEGWAVKTNRYDKNVLSGWSVFGANREPITLANGVHSAEYTIDDNRRIVSARNYGIDGKPVLNKEGIFETVYDYDDRGFTVGYKYYGCDGRPVNDIYGKHRQACVFNNRNQITEECFFNKDGQPAVDTSKGYAKAISAYNRNGMATDIEYFDTNGRLTDNKMGYARTIQRFDNDGNVELFAVLDHNNQPTDILLNGTFMSMSVAMYDDNQLNSAFMKFDSDREELFIGARYDDPEFGSAYLTRTFNGAGEIRYMDGTHKLLEYKGLDVDSLSIKYHHYLDSLKNEADKIVDRYLNELSTANK